jgi:propionyl-CoA synthetase
MSQEDPAVAAYAEAYQRSLADPEGFWLEAAGLIDWTVTPPVAVDGSRPPFCRWFPAVS